VVDLSFFNAVAHDIRAMLEEGRREEAVEATVKYLRASDDEVSHIAAHLLLPPKLKRGAPKKGAPPFWYEIGERFEKLKDELNPDGRKKQRHEIMEQLRKEFPSRRQHSIDKALAFYNRAMAADRKIV
jgi:hypothetical protein